MNRSGGEGPGARAPETTAALVTGGTGAGSAAPRAGTEPLFQVSEVLAERFRVVRLLGRGGMGEVYEVDDLELGERVAVKTLRSHLLASDRALALFRNEIQLARRVTHPNVCRVFDVFRHRREVGGAGESLALVTMERLPGETLAQRLGDDGPLAPAQALPILRQIADALDAAHAAGIVHRDLKSTNVVLVDRPGGPRAVVTDFGIAAAAEEAGAMGAAPTGTAPYMAPEQRSGTATGPAADLYAFGVLVRETVTGRAAARPGESSGLPPGWAPVVARCLAREPAERPASARDVYRRLAAVGRRRRRATRGAVAAASVLATVLAGFALLPSVTPPGRDAGAPAAQTPPAPARPSLALTVSPAAGRGARESPPRWVAVAVSMLLAGELAALDLDLAPLSPPFAAGVVTTDPGHRAAAGVTVAGTPAGGLRLDLEVRTAGERSRTAARIVAIEALPEQTADLAAVIAERLGLKPAPGAAERRRARFGDHPAALEALARGVTAFDEGRRAQRIPHLSKAVDLEPSAFEPRRALAEALLSVARRADARDHAAAAQRLAGSLGPEERQLAATLVAESDGDSVDAAAAGAELVRLRPGRLDFALRQAFLLLDSQQGARTRQLLDAVAQRLPGAARDPLYLLATAALAGLESDTAGRIELGRSARRRAEELDLPGLAFAGLGEEYEAQRVHGRVRDIERVAIEAVSLARSVADPQMLGRALRWRSVAHVRAGEVEDGRRTLAAAVAEARRAGDLENLHWCLNNLAYVAQLDGDLETAERLFGETLDLLRQGGAEAGDLWAILFVRLNLADLIAQRGRLEEAHGEAREILIGARSIGSTELEAATLAQLARTALRRGELDEASHLIDTLEVLAAEEQRIVLSVTRALAADLGRLRGDLVAARRLAERSLDTLDRAGAAEHRVYALEVRALVESELAGPAAGLEAMRAARAAARDLGFVNSVARIERRTARLERLQGNLSAARRILARALAVHERTGAELELAHDRLELARLRSAGGDAAGAAAAARQTLAVYRRLSHRDGVEDALALLTRDPAAGAGGEA